MPRAAVFLDRDDTLIRNRTLPPPPPPAAAGDLVDPESVELLPGAFAACTLLVDLGFPLIVVTNQGVVARGGIDMHGLKLIHAKLESLLTRDGQRLLTAIYACPYHPKGNVPPYNREHPWRKPLPGMFIAAAKEHDLDLANSWMIGDAPRDIEAAIAAGISPARALLIGESAESRFDSIASASSHISTECGRAEFREASET